MRNNIKSIVNSTNSGKQIYVSFLWEDATNDTASLEERLNNLEQ